MLTDRDPNSSGRGSRASNASAMGRPAGRYSRGADKPDDLPSAAPGIMSMLRTSTEMGNVAGLAEHMPGVGGYSRPPQRRGASSRLSTASSHSNHSSRASRQHAQWPSSSNAPMRSSGREPMMSQYVPDTLSPTAMNIPGSSPSGPVPARARDGYRSRSMTHTMQPNFNLSSNRSLGSLRHVQVQRPKSPYIYESTRIPRGHHGPASPAPSDIAGPYRCSQYGYGNAGQAQYNGQMRRRIPSDASLGYHDRGHRMLPHTARGPSPGYHTDYRSDIPPVPPLSHQHFAAEQARKLNRSAKGSASSGSVNLRAESDQPSSDMASPPTPNDGLPMEVLSSSRGKRNVDATTGVVREGSSSGALHYDYSEPYENEQILEPDSASMSTAHVSRVNTATTGRRSVAEKRPSMARAPVSRPSMDLVHTQLAGIAELPASPVGRRITRDTILKALEPSSTTGDIGTSTKLPSSGSNPQAVLADNTPSEMPRHIEPGKGGMTSTPSNLESDKNNRHSILSQTGSSVLESSTLNFAVRYSIPMATGAGFGTDLPQSASAPHMPASPGRSTEDGMSELLAGYQHTESKRESDLIPDNEAAPMKGNNLDEQPERRSNHAQQSSDEQSFKSCTDLAEPAASPEKRANETAMPPESIAPGHDPSVKDSDARSFTTCKDAITPDRGSTKLPEKLPTSNLVNEVPQDDTLAYQLPATSPAVLRKKPPVLPRESSFSFVANILRGGSKPSVKKGSESISVSSSTLSISHKTPPVVPPRESSSSKEAQRVQSVTSYLLRRLPSRFSKGRKTAKNEDVTETDPNEKTASSVTQSASTPMAAPSASQLRLDVIETPRKASPKQDVLTDKEAPPLSTHKVCGSSKVLSRSLTPGVLQHSFSSPLPVIPEPSSVYSPVDVSFRSRLHSSPAGVPKPAEHGRRDSQTTTHLVWHGQKFHNVSSGSTSGSRLPIHNADEGSTTDLRLSGYKYASPLQYLPDLQEESHEDSSLNTSASNLKSTIFRPAFGSHPAIRSSVDDAAVRSGRSSLRSPRQSFAISSPGQACGLPSMHFSQMNLIDKLNEKFGYREEEPSTNDAQEPPKNDVPTSISVSEARERYNSLFAELDLELKKSGAPAQPTAVMDLITSKRAHSPETLMAEIDQLTIPSIGGLTQRISEMIPSLREYYQIGEQGEFPEEEVIMEQAMEELEGICAPTQKRSSARLRPVPGSPNMLVIDDCLYEELTSKDKATESPGHVTGKVNSENGSDTKGKGKSANPQQTHQTALATKSPPQSPSLISPSPAVVRLRSLTVGPQDLGARRETSVPSWKSQRSFVSTPTATDTRPWNSDKNYPWATTTIPSVDISLPPPAAVRSSPGRGPSHLRNRFSSASSLSSFSTEHTATTSPFGTASRSGAYAKQHRFSIFGRPGDQPHAVGERYPTSALTPPTAIFRDHSSAFDTSDDESFSAPPKNKLGLRKRFSTAHKTTLDNTGRAGRSKTNPSELASPESSQQTPTSIQQDLAGEASAFTGSNRHTFRDAEGMRLADYHRNKIIQNIKKLWHRSGILIRQLSRRKRRASSA